ncbi:Xylanase A (modular protein) [Verrucomicrobia bacterium]|nr:Xylanase A (modular protein) [Verrucomicrobiota bacterium]
MGRRRADVKIKSKYLFLLSLACFQVKVLALDITLDPNQPGRTFEGIGAVSAGASSRLLIDYPEPQRGQILDYLFKPHFGAALQHLKVEIGGGVNSTDGTEPTHMRSPADQNYNRGFEWWLMQQAKARNPTILLDCLAWGAPGWIGGGNYYSQDMCNYITNFVQGAQRAYGLDFNFTGTHNEAAVNAAWIKQLRSALDAGGRQSVLLVAADEWGGSWNIVTNPAYGLLVDSALSNAVARIGAHYPGSSSPLAAQACGKPLWSSEDGIGGSTWAAARKLGKLFNRNYVTGKMTKTEIWSPVTCYYDILAASDSGLMRANTPWSGNYQVAPAIWAAAHTAQFAFPGWTYLEGGACALLPSGGSIATLHSSNSPDYSIIIETFDASAAQTITFHLTNGLSSAVVNLWQTTQTNQFIQIGQLTPMNGSFTYTFQPECIYTLSTTTGQSKGGATPPSAAPFPVPFKDDFESYPVATTPKYFSDQAGTFETFVRADGQGQSLRQVLTQPGIRWTAEWSPYTLIGDASWTDYDVGANVLVETNGGFVFVMGRVGTVPGFSDPLPRGYWLALNNATAQWELHSSSNLLASGAATIPTNTWHNLRLAMQGASLRCYVDNVLVTNLLDYTYAHGMAAMGCGWHTAQFDNFTVRRLHRVDFNLARTAIASASSVWQNDPTYAASMVNDGDPTTRWNTAYPTASNEWIELDFPTPATFNRTTYSQFDNRIFGYQIQHWNGSGWTSDVNGGTMGAFASDTFATVTSTKVRLLLTNFNSAPSIYEFEVHTDAPPSTVAPVRINEWMADNTHTLPDPAGDQFQPWFELYNAGATDVDLAGYFLSGSITNLFVFQIPSGYLLPARGFLLVWTDGLINQNSGAGFDLHVNFSLAQVQVIALFDNLGQLVDAVDLAPQPPDGSSGSNPDGDPAILNLVTPSPRRSNNQISALPPARRASDGALLLTFSGFPFLSHRILAATTLAPALWSNLAFVTADALGGFAWPDSNAPAGPHRFYRASWP